MISSTDRNRIARYGEGVKLAQWETARAIQSDATPFLLARLDSSTPMPNSVYRWVYTWVRAEIRPSGYGGAGGTQNDFRDRPGETWETGTAINVCEASNSATFVGPGYNPANFPQGWQVKPIQGHVLIYPARRCDEAVSGTPISGGGGLVWLFYAPNAIDGTC
jgi:hypothetical protein